MPQKVGGTVPGRTMKDRSSLSACPKHCCRWLRAGPVVPTETAALGCGISGHSWRRAQPCPSKGWECSLRYQSCGLTSSTFTSLLLPSLQEVFLFSENKSDFKVKWKEFPGDPSQVFTCQWKGQGRSWSGRILPAMGQLLKPSHLAPMLHNKKKLTHSSRDSAQSKKKKKRCSTGS